MNLYALRSLLLAILVVVPTMASAQTQNPPAAQSQTPPAAQTQNPPAAQSQTPPAAQAQNPPATDEQLLKPEELDALVAPIALYPDALLAQILMASTYPLEVVQAERWVNQNKKLKGDELKAATDKQAWDETVKALVATPSVLTMMSTKLDWTQKLGDAVLAQQPDVMDAVQRLRTKADANKKLTSTKEQKVTKTQQQGKQVIVIEPTNPGTVYVPYYDPAVVYGGWPYPAYPPYSYYPPGYVAGGILATGLAFGAGYALGRWASGGSWGGSVNWNNNNININGGNNFQHRPEHRQGARYNNPKVQQRYGNNNLRGGSQGRMDFRGNGGQQVLKPGGGQGAGAGQRPGQGAGAGQRPSGGGRPSAGQQPSGGRPSAGQRPSGGNNAFGNIQSGRSANTASQRGHASVGGGGGGGARVGGGGGGGGRGGGGGGGGRGGGGGGRRSDIMLKHDISLIGRLDNGLGFYRFTYNGGNKAYVGVMAQEVQAVMPDAVTTGQDGYLRVNYDKLGLKFESYSHWLAAGAHIPSTARIQR